MKSWLAKIFLCLLTALPFFCFGNETSVDDYDENISEEMRILPEDLLITDDGLFLIEAEAVLPLRAVYSNSKGLFARKCRRPGKISNQCDNGHEIYHQACGGCANWWCIYRCKCYSPWNG